MRERLDQVQRGMVEARRDLGAVIEVALHAEAFVPKWILELLDNRILGLCSDSEAPCAG